MNNNLITDQLPPPLPLQPPRSSLTCDRHHNDTFTGFCPSCLSERLTILDQPTTTTTTTTDLRRTKSFSVNVNTLSSLFSTDDTNLNDLEDEIVEMEAKIDSIVDNLKSFNLDSHSRKKSNFWSKWKKWRNKSNGVVLSTTLPVGKYRETQSEVADYGYGRRSCDIDSGTSRVLFDKPRASWDGYMIGRSFPRLNVNVVQRSDMHIPVEERGKIEDCIPGGSIQTREYYLDSKRRKSIDRSNSIRKMNEVSNSKVSPGIMDYNHIHCRSRFNSIGGENELGTTSFGSELLNKETNKKSRWWSWKGLGFINRKGGKATNHDGDKAKLSRSSTSVSWRNTKTSSIENSNNRWKGDDFVFERNASARYSPNHVNEGLLRFYLTPLRLRGSRQRSGAGTGTGKGKLF